MRAYPRGLDDSALLPQKRGVDAAAHVKGVLHELDKDVHQDPFALLFPRDSPTP